jgi:hypothetical protein
MHGTPPTITARRMSATTFLGALGISTMLFAAPAAAVAPKTTVEYQPMVSTGLAAGHPFEAWFVFDKSAAPAVAGYDVPAGASIRFTFPKPFRPTNGAPLAAVMLNGWVQGPIPAKFTTSLDPGDRRTVVIRFDGPITAGSAENPGLKAIHLRTSEMNPHVANDYPITVEFRDAGPLDGSTVAVARITRKPVPNIAAYNQLHDGKDEDYQHVAAGEKAALPIDFLVTLPDQSRAVISVKPTERGFAILCDGKPIGTIRTQGVPMTLKPVTFGPGFARLGIIELSAIAGSVPGTVHIIAALDGGTSYVITLVVT